MGVSGAVLALMAATPAASIHWLTVPELSETHIATDFRGATALIDAAHPVQSAQNAALGTMGDRGDRAMTRATGTVPLAIGDNDDAIMDVVFSHQTGEPTVSVSLKQTVGRGSFWTRDLIASIQLSDGQIFKVLNSDAGPAAPLVATIPVAAICSLGQDASVKLGFNPGSGLSETYSQTVIADVRHLNGMDALVSQACSPAGSP
jgi:hypothetical protein